MSWLVHILGMDSGSGYWYLWWSGVGANLGEFAILGGLFANYRKHTCHVNSPRFCWRLGVHPVEGTPFRACGKHHPAVPNKISAQRISDAYGKGGPR